jgi:hypothetical protein
MSSNTSTFELVIVDAFTSSAFGGIQPPFALSTVQNRRQAMRCVTRSPPK